MSKTIFDAKKEIRNVWTINPVSRIKKSKKVYSRKNKKRENEF